MGARADPGIAGPAGGKTKPVSGMFRFGSPPWITAQLPKAVRFRGGSPGARSAMTSDPPASTLLTPLVAWARARRALERGRTDDEPAEAALPARKRSPRGRRGEGTSPDPRAHRDAIVPDLHVSW
jgi:hypothetical protein